MVNSLDRSYTLCCAISIAYYSAKKDYEIIREFPSGKGYADLVFLPRRESGKPALVVELKYDKTAKGAVEQIKDKNYPKTIESYIGKILLIGVNYEKENKKHTCIIEEWKREKLATRLSCLVALVVGCIICSYSGRNTHLPLFTFPSQLLVIPVLP